MTSGAGRGVTFYLIDQQPVSLLQYLGGVIFAGRTQGTPSQDRAEHHYSNCRVNICVISTKQHKAGDTEGPVVCTA